MAKMVATILGAAFVLVGLLGFIAPGMLGMHLSTAHNLIHIVSGAIALYFGLAGTLAAARMFNIIFGVVYLLLGLVGFLAGTQATPSMPDMTPNAHLLKILPGTLEFGTMDHVVHILLGLVFILGGVLTRGDVRRAVEE
jgi:hypothetical protein